ncbi:hypothetical protein JCM10212_004478 [Sporobolomyces blumeae]
MSLADPTQPCAKLFSGLTAFFSPLIPPSTRALFCFHGGQLAGPDDADLINLIVGIHGRHDELVERLRALDFEVIDHAWLQDSVRAGRRVDLAAYRFDVLDHDDRLAPPVSSRDAAGSSTLSTVLSGRSMQATNDVDRPRVHFLDDKRDRLHPNPATHAYWSHHNATYALEKRSMTQSLDWDGQSLWTSSISVGTPPRSYRVYFDTASADLALPGPLCNDASCDGKTRYDPKESSTANSTTFQVTTTWTEGTSGTGLLVRDTVSIGATTVMAQDIVVQAAFGSSVADRAADGVGLAFRDLSAARSYAFPFTLFQQKPTARVFAFLLSRFAGQSKIFFDGLDRAAVGSTPVFFPVAKDPDEEFRTYWQIADSTAYIDGARAYGGQTRFIFDSGSSLILAPTTAAEDFWASFPGSRAEDNGFWSYPCDSPPKVALSFGGNTKLFAIDQDDFNVGEMPTDPGRCLGALVGHSMDLWDSWIIGDVFFKSWLLIFDVSKFRIGIAAPRTF